VRRIERERVGERERIPAIDATTQLSSARAGGNCCGSKGVSANDGGEGWGREEIVEKYCARPYCCV